MASYSFRIRCNVPERSGVTWDRPELVVSPDGHRPEVRLMSTGPEIPLSATKRFVVRSDGYPTEQGAWAEATKYRDALIRAFARLRIAVDFGDRAAKSQVYEAGLQMMEQASGHCVLNDVHGIMVFPTESKPGFVSMGGLGLRTPASGDRLVNTVTDVLETECEVSDRERLAYDLFSSSFSASTADARFLDLMMAVETLLDPKPRSDLVLEHVERLIASTREAAELPRSERNSICGALAWLRVQSIGQAGRELASSLGGKRYRKMTPPEFFSACYDVRSKLVHGAYPRPSREEVGSLAANLELFVSDLLGGAGQPPEGMNSWVETGA
jgi:hypothetical protein